LIPLTEETVKEEIEEAQEITEELDEEVEPLRTNFTLPRKIKVTKLIISLVLNVLIGGTSFALAIVWFVNPPEVTVTWKVFAWFLVIFGVVLLGQFPIALVRTFNTRLILGKNTIRYRNSFFWNQVKWADIQDILIQQKLTRDLAENELVGIGIVRFRTVTKGYIFIGDTYPVHEAEGIIQSTKEVFEIYLEETEYKLKIAFERPSAQTRYIYFQKELRE
jgi:hypothetical protein